MKLHRIIVFAMVLLPLSQANAYWPTTVEENLPISVTPGLYEGYPDALPYPDGGTLVTYSREDIFNCYQIIDKYGEFVFEEPQLLSPAVSDPYIYHADLLPDGSGGAIAVYRITPYSFPAPGIYAQRLDSLGSILWGDSAKMVLPYTDVDFDISIDGEGGFFVAIAIDEPEADWTDLYVQRVDGDGNPLWGENGVQVAALPNAESRFPKITLDGTGGCFVVWVGSYNLWGALYAQHLDGDGNILWAQDLFICESVWGHHVIPDGEGGFILQANPGTADYNTHWRIDGDGNILWTRERLSWFFESPMICGEPGFFYLGFQYTNENYYGQRVDMDGNNYWPTWGSGQPGAEMEVSDIHIDGMGTLAYSYPYFYSIYVGKDPFNYDIKGLFVQKVDSLGNRQWGDSGTHMTWHRSESTQIPYISNVIDTSGGVTGIYQLHSYPPSERDVWAKHVNSDGSLGGPLPAVSDVTISVSGNDIVLTWPVMADSAEYYIYKSTEPYSFPAEPDTSVTDTTFIDINGIFQDSCFYSIKWQLLVH